MRLCVGKRLGRMPGAFKCSVILGMIILLPSHSLLVLLSGL